MKKIKDNLVLFFKGFVMGVANIIPGVSGGTLAVILGVLFLCLIQPGLLAVWMIFGISLPMYLVIKFTTPIYYRFAKIDFKKISDQIDEELRNEK